MARINTSFTYSVFTDQYRLIQKLLMKGKKAYIFITYGIGEKKGGKVVKRKISDIKRS